MKLSKSSIVKISKDSVHCDVEDEVVILGMNDGVYYGLNPLAAFIWNLIQVPISINEIHSAILEEYEVTKEKSESDLMELLNELLDKGLIEVTDENNS
jgi:Coenzyme PQQ synthesis protein D (PqqD)